MKNKLTPKSCGHKTVPLDHFHSYKIILESVDTILYPHTNLYPTLFNIYIYIFNIYIYILVVLRPLLMHSCLMVQIINIPLLDAATDAAVSYLRKPIPHTKQPFHRIFSFFAP